MRTARSFEQHLVTCISHWLLFYSIGALSYYKPLSHIHTHTRTFMYAKWVCASTFRLTFTHRSNSGFSICLMQPGDQTFHRRMISRHPALPPKPQSPGSCHMYFFIGFLWESELHRGLVNRRKVRRIERFSDVHRHHTSDPQLTCQWPVSVRGLCVCVY